MNVYLLTWNPAKWPWDDLEQCIEDTQSGIPVNTSWSTGGTKRIQPGDLAFMMRLGTEPKGIMGRGRFTSSWYPGPHWSGVVGKEAIYVNVEFSTLLCEENLIDLEFLKEKYPQMNWTPMASGASMGDDVAQELLRIIKGVEEELSYASPTTLQEGTLRRVVADRRERNSEARRQCIAHYGATCAVCQFDFEKFYGPAGRDFIHVHHLEPLRNAQGAQKVEPILDLIPVCANCHSMIHRRKTPYTIAEMKDMVAEHGVWGPSRKKTKI